MTIGIVGVEAGLMCVVSAKLAFDRFGVVLRADSCDAVIQRDDKWESLVVAVAADHESTIRIGGERFGHQLDAVLASEM
jgi:hypothetical protein